MYRISSKITSTVNWFVRPMQCFILCGKFSVWINKIEGFTSDAIQNENKPLYRYTRCVLCTGTVKGILRRSHYVLYCIVCMHNLYMYNLLYSIQVCNKLKLMGYGPSVYQESIKNTLWTNHSVRNGKHIFQSLVNSKHNRFWDR